MIAPAALAAAVVLSAGYLWLQMKTLRQWTGAFFVVGCTPLVVWGLWLTRLVRNPPLDSSAHTLFPFEMAFIAAGAFVFLGVVAAIRMVRGKPKGNA
jgi:disulfide bond formation protein DsbB